MCQLLEEVWKPQRHKALVLRRAGLSMVVHPLCSWTLPERRPPVQHLVESEKAL